MCKLITIKINKISINIFSFITWLFIPKKIPAHKKWTEEMKEKLLTAVD